jgi:CheY-like chemotaxis protein
MQAVASPNAPEPPLALVVEDDPDAAAIASGMLRALGWRVQHAADGAAALQEIAARRPDLVLLDVCLPVMDGVNFLRVARRVAGRADVPVVAASAVYPRDGDISKLLRGLGVEKFLSKPFTTLQLQAAVADVLTGANQRLPPTASMPTRSPQPMIRRKEPEPAPPMRNLASAVTAKAPAPYLSAAPPAPSPMAASSPTPESRTPESRPPEPRPTTAPQRPTTAPQPPTTARGPAEAPATPARPRRTASLGEVPATCWTSGQALDVRVRGATPTTVVFASGSRWLPPKAAVRMEIFHRDVVNDAMTDLVVKLLAEVVRCEPGPAGGYLIEARIQAASPGDAFAKLISWLDRTHRL